MHTIFKVSVEFNVFVYSCGVTRYNTEINRINVSELTGPVRKE